MACKRMRVNPETGKILRRGERRMTVAFKGLSRDVEVKGWFPDDGSGGLMERGDTAPSHPTLVLMTFLDRRP